MASMVVLSAMASVNLSVPEQEMEVIVNQLRSDCTLLLSDREGQQALGKLLRHPKGRSLVHAIKGLKRMAVEANVGPIHATLPLSRPVQPSECTFISITISPSLLHPALKWGFYVRSPGGVRA